MWTPTGAGRPEPWSPSSHSRRMPRAVSAAGRGRSAAAARAARAVSAARRARSAGAAARARARPALAGSTFQLQSVIILARLRAGRPGGTADPLAKLPADDTDCHWPRLACALLRPRGQPRPGRRAAQADRRREIDSSRPRSSGRTSARACSAPRSRRHGEDPRARGRRRRGRGAARPARARARAAAAEARPAERALPPADAKLVFLQRQHRPRRSGWTGVVEIYISEPTEALEVVLGRRASPTCSTSSTT